MTALGRLQSAPIVLPKTLSSITIELAVYGFGIIDVGAAVYRMFHRHSLDGVHGCEDNPRSTRFVWILHDIPRDIDPEHDDVLLHWNRQTGERSRSEPSCRT